MKRQFSAPRILSAQPSVFKKQRLVSGGSTSALTLDTMEMSRRMTTAKIDKPQIRIDSAQTEAPARKASQLSIKRIQSAALSKVNSEVMMIEETNNSQRRIVVTESNMTSPEIQKRARYDPEVKYQLMVMRVQQIKNLNLRNFIKRYILRMKSIIDIFKSQQFEKVLYVIQELMENAYRTKSVVLLLEVLTLGGYLCQQSKLYEHCVFLYQQARVLSSHCGRRHDKYKLRCFIGFSECAFSLKRYEQSIKFLKKCLQYAWASQDVDTEMEVYEKLHLNYFYMGQLSKSDFYHQRALIYDYELDSSPLKIMGIDMLRIFLEKTYPTVYSDKITLGLLNKVELPVSNDLIHEEVPDYEALFNMFGGDSPVRASRRTSKNARSETSSMSPLQFSSKGLPEIDVKEKDPLNQIMGEKEFEFEVYTPKHSFRSESKCFTHLKKPPRTKDVYHNPKLKNSAFNLSDLGVVSRKNSENPLENVHKYKLPLPKQISIRVKKRYEFGDAMFRVRSQMDLGHRFQQHVDKIQVNHKSSMREKTDQLQKDKRRMTDLNSKLNETLEVLFNL